MMLKQLIENLEQLDPNLVVPNGFGNPHSYRGYYEDLAFEPMENVTVGQMLADAKESLGKTFTGYKGGEFKMGEYTDVFLAEHGYCGEELGLQLLKYMLAEATNKKNEGNAMRFFKLLEDLPGCRAGTTSELGVNRVCFFGDICFSLEHMLKYPSFFQEIKPEWTDEDMIRFRSKSATPIPPILYKN